MSGNRSFTVYRCSGRKTRRCDFCRHDSLACPGLIPVSQGKTLKEKYHITCVFVDQCTKLVYVTYQLSTSAAETVESKHAFEKWAASHGVKIKYYRADNGAFNIRVFKESVAAARQTIDFCGAYAHHQNGVAERMIQTLTYRARSLLLHAMFHWTDVVTAQFWPFPLRLVVDTHNNTPLPNGLCPIELFANVKHCTCVKDYHTFGCPAYVLDSHLCNGGRVPKWNPRARRGIYLGMLPNHASNVALIYNVSTGYVSPQYHVVYDNDFTSVERKSDSEMRATWDTLFKTNRDVPPDDYMEVDDPQWKDVSTPAEANTPVDVTLTSETSVPEGDSTPSEGDVTPSEGDNTPSEGDNGIHDPPHLAEARPMSNSSSRREGENTNDTNVMNHHNDSPTCTRTGRAIVQPNRYKNLVAMACGLLTSQFVQPITCDRDLTLHTASLFKAEINYLDLLDKNIDDGSSNLMDPRLLLATDSNNDNLHYGGAMAAPDKQDFLLAMKKEISDLTKDKVWRLELKKNIPAKAKLIRLIWSFKRKRNPLGELLKHKARLCVLLLTELAGWHSRQIDYVLAFSQTPIDTTVYCHLPAGFHVENGDRNEEYVIVLEKNLYGTKQATANWFEMLRDNLLKEGFRQSAIDPCLFLKSDIVIVTYVDDCLIFSDSEETIDGLLERLQKTFKLTDEGEDVKAYLGLKVDKDKDGTITITQPALIQRILNLLDLVGEKCACMTHRQTRFCSKMKTQKRDNKLGIIEAQSGC